MAGEIAAGARDGPPEFRASHADRDSVVEQLRVAAGDGRLTPAELDERLEAALTAKTYAELAILTADLPAAPPAGRAPQRPRDLLRLDMRGGNVSKSGPWVVPARIEAEVKGGNVKLDLTRAAVTYPVLAIDANVRGGNVILVIKPGIAVDVDDLAVVGGNVKFRSGTDKPAPVTLRVELSGQIRGGNVVVRLPRRSFWQWLAGRPRPYA